MIKIEWLTLESRVRASFNEFNNEDFMKFNKWPILVLKKKDKIFWEKLLGALL